MRLPKEIREKFVRAGRKGGKAGTPENKAKGGVARMKQLTEEQRKELASRAGKASAAKRKRISE